MRIFDYIRRYKWDLGIALASEGHRYDAPQWNFHIVKAPKDCWYADPFILDITDSAIIVLAEEYSYNIKRGRIAKLTIDKQSYKLKSAKIVLDLPTHLSFPAIIRVDDRIYVYPENSATGLCTMYSYNPDTDEFKAVEQLCSEPLTDAIITDEFSNHTLVATKIPIDNGNTVFVYQSSDLFGQYKEVQQIVLKDNTARSAGYIFKDENRIIRVAQNCNDGYGVGLVFQELGYNNGKYTIQELFRKQPPKGYEGMHTYNSYKGYTIVDFHTRRYPILHKILQKIKHL